MKNSCFTTLNIHALSTQHKVSDEIPKERAHVAPDKTYICLLVQPFRSILLITCHFNIQRSPRKHMFVLKMIENLYLHFEVWQCNSTCRRAWTFTSTYVLIIASKKGDTYNNEDEKQEVRNMSGYIEFFVPAKLFTTYFSNLQKNMRLSYIWIKWFNICDMIFANNVEAIFKKMLSLLKPMIL